MVGNRVAFWMRLAKAAKSKPNVLSPDIAEKVVPIDVCRTSGAMLAGDPLVPLWQSHNGWKACGERQLCQHTTGEQLVLS